jgi:hypothetical protein
VLGLVYSYHITGGVARLVGKWGAVSPALKLLAVGCGLLLCAHPARKLRKRCKKTGKI